MTDRKCSARTWADAIADVIKQAERDGWRVGIGERADLEYVLEVYAYDPYEEAEVKW